MAPRYCTQLIWPRAPFRLSRSTWKLTQSPVVWLLLSRVQAATSPVYFSTFQTSRRSAWRWHPNAYGERTMSDMMKETETAAKTLGLELMQVAVRNPDQFE